jgi:hypothetical protein
VKPPTKFYAYAVVETNVVPHELVTLELTRREAREYVKHLGAFGRRETLRVRRAKVTLFDS